MRWTKLAGNTNDAEGLSTLDLPWLGAIQSDSDSVVLSLKYLGGNDPTSGTWSKVLDKEGDRVTVQFAGAPYRIVEVRLPAKLVERAGGTAQAMNRAIDSFFTSKGVTRDMRLEWEKIVNSATEQVDCGAAAA